MHSFKFPSNLLNDMTQSFSIERNNTIIGNARGFFCGEKYPSTIQLVENTDIKNSDWLISALTNQRYYVKDAQPIIIDGKPSNWMIKYQTEQEYNQNNATIHNSIFNIQSINGNSVVGSQANVTLNIGASLNDITQLINHFSADEKVEAQELLAELERTQNSTHPVLVEGSLSKFSDLLKKHSDLLVAVGGWAVQLLIGK